MNTRLLPLAFLLFAFKFSLAQELPTYSPNTPESSSLMKYIDNPVSNYTGKASVSIPIYTIESRDLTVPISLNYHSGGIGVAEESSWVGLGWSLQAGGVITRKIRGLDDLKVEGYYFNSELPDPPTSPPLTGDYSPTYHDLVRGVYGSNPPAGLYQYPLYNDGIEKDYFNYLVDPGYDWTSDLYYIFVAWVFREICF